MRRSIIYLFFLLPCISNSASSYPPVINYKIGNRSAFYTDLEKMPVLLLKYAIILDTIVEALEHEDLYSFIDEWMGVKYQYGGNSMSGIDCSSFANTLYEKIYKTTLPRTSAEQFLFTSPIPVEDLTEGDLLFFKTGGSTISHVGVYLGNGRFVHASTMKGVTIDRLDFPYYKKTLVGAGRIVHN
jgi:lipoprotein Spr